MGRVNPMQMPNDFEEDEPILVPREDQGLVEDDGETESEPNPLSQQVQLLQEQVQQNSVLNQLMQDPQIRAYVNAKMAGQDAQLVGQQQAQTEPEEEEPVDLETMNNTELFGHVTKKMTKTIAGLIDEKLRPLQDMAQGLQRSQQEQVAGQVQGTIAELRKKYPDFDRFRKQMVLLNNQVSGTLGPEDLYRLAKSQAGFNDPSRQANVRTETERPVSTSAAPSRARSKQQQQTVAQPRNSRQAFKDALDNALGRVTF